MQHQFQVKYLDSSQKSGFGQGFHAAGLKRKHEHKQKRNKVQNETRVVLELNLQRH